MLRNIDLIKPYTADELNAVPNIGHIGLTSHPYGVLKLDTQKHRVWFDGTNVTIEYYEDGEWTCLDVYKIVT